MEWLITTGGENGKGICNFKPEVIELVDIYADATTEPVTYVMMRLVFSDGTQGEAFSVPLSGLDSEKWLNRNKRCRFNPDVAEIKAGRYIADEVRQFLPHVETKKLYRLNQLGVHVIDGEPIFNTGKVLIRPITNHRAEIEVQSEPSHFSMDIDSDLSEFDATDGMLELVSLSPNVGRVILAQVLLYIMRRVYEDVWKSPCCIVYLYGESGIQKTTYSTFLTQMYNRGSGITSPARLNASIPAAVEIIYEKADCVEPLDDLFPSESKGIRRSQEETLIEITRIIGDGIEPARMRGKSVAKKPPKCGVMFTGEYLIGTGSNAARLLPIEAIRLDNLQLKHFQDNPLIVSTFYYNFIQWFIDNYYDIRDLLKEWRNAYQKAELKVHDRLKESHFFLGTAYTILLQYLHGKSFISKQDAERLHRSFQDLLTGLTKAQQLRVVEGKLINTDSNDILSCIRSMFKNNQLRLADTAKQFNPKEHDGVIYDGCLCLYGKVFRDKICPSASAVSCKDAVATLEVKGALVRGTDKCTKQISTTGNKRFYFIKLEALQ